MSKILVVFGATGQQGGSLIDYVLNDATLSKDFKIRGVTRSVSSSNSQVLQKKGVEVVEADANDAASLRKALNGAHTVFGVTVSIYDDEIGEREFVQGKAMADAAVAEGAKYFIWSTLPNAGRIANGKIKHLAHFDVKEEVEEYIRSLKPKGLKSAFFAPGGFMQNYHGPMGPRALEDGSGTYAISNFVSAETLLPLIDTVGDTGKYVGAILAEPEVFEGKALCAATALYSFDEVAAIMSKMSGKKVVYKQLPESVWRSLLPATMGDYIGDMFLWMQNFGYYGPQTREKVEWTAGKARGKLASLEDYLTRFPLEI